MKSFTDINQSSMLAEILPLESADMCWEVVYASPKGDIIEYANKPMIGYIKHCLPAWSLAALLGIIPSSSLDSSDDHYFRLRCKERFSEWHDNPIDACYEMILKLYNFKML